MKLISLSELIKGLLYVPQARKRAVSKQYRTEFFPRLHTAPCLQYDQCHRILPGNQFFLGHSVRKGLSRKVFHTGGWRSGDYPKVLSSDWAGELEYNYRVIPTEKSPKPWSLQPVTESMSLEGSIARTTSVSFSSGYGGPPNCPQPSL